VTFPAQDDLSQRDLSDLPIEQMSPAERAELRRRYETFVRSFGRLAPPRGTLDAMPMPRRRRPANAE
jgi:hypothetical protein